MRNVIVILRKNLRLALADRKGLAIAFLLPFLLASIMGVTFSGAGKGSSKLKVGVVRKDSSPAVERLVASLKSSDALEIVECSDEEEARLRVRKRERLAVLVFPEGCGAKLAGGFFTPEKAEIRLLIDPSRQAERGILQGILVQKTMEALSADAMNPDKARAWMERGLAGVKGDAGLADGERAKWAQFMRTGMEMFDRLKEAQAAEKKAGSADAFRPRFSEPFRLAVEEVSAETGKKFNMFAQSFAGTGVMFLLFAVMDGGLMLIRERNRGTLRRILAAPVSRLQILAGESLFIFTFTLAQLAVLFAAGRILFGIPFAGSKAGLVAVSIATCAAATGFGVLIAALGRTERQVGGISVLVILVTSALGGSMIPLWLMPDFVQVLGSFTITKWAVMGFEGATWRGLGFVDIVWPNAAVLGGMAAVLFGLAAAKFRWE